MTPPSLQLLLYLTVPQCKVEEEHFRHYFQALGPLALLCLVKLVIMWAVSLLYLFAVVSTAFSSSSPTVCYSSIKIIMDLPHKAHH